MVNVSFVILSDNTSTEPSRTKRRKNDFRKSYDNTCNITVKLANISEGVTDFIVCKVFY